MKYEYETFSVAHYGQVRASIHHIHQTSIDTSISRFDDLLAVEVYCLAFVPNLATQKAPREGRRWRT